MKSGLKRTKNVCTKTAHDPASFTREIRNTGNNNLPEITFSYVLKDLNEEIIDEIIKCELTRSEKIGSLMELDKNRIIEILKKLGIKKQLTETN